MVCFRILGPVEVYRGERRVALAGPQQVALLAFLLVHANRAVSIDRLIDALWSERDPAGAVKRVQVAIGRLRRVLERDRPQGVEPVVRTVAEGYVLAVRSGELDAEVFRAGVEEGSAAVAGGDPARGAEVLRRALGLCRGPALADVAYEPWAQANIALLEELRLAATEARVEADLQLGRHGELIGGLQSLVREHPTRERLVSELMLALYRTGRQADALATYRDAMPTMSDVPGTQSTGSPAHASAAAAFLALSCLSAGARGSASRSAGGAGGRLLNLDDLHDRGHARRIDEEEHVRAGRGHGRRAGGGDVQGVVGNGLEREERDSLTRVEGVRDRRQTDPRDLRDVASLRYVCAEGLRVGD
jgi:DNA-binding SARP family transcriptional activator